MPNSREGAGTFLTVSEALETVVLDARMYPDPVSFAKVLAAMAGGEATPGEIVLDPGWPVVCVGVWYQPSEADEPRFIQEVAFAEGLVKAVADKVPSPEVVAEAYSRAMDVSAVAGVDERGEPGVWVDTEMERFRCVRCGHCCRNLGDAFATSASSEDVDRWAAEGRLDILEWVDLRFRDLGMMNLWLDPATGDEVTCCPWLRKVPREARYLCRIHETKPRHCREYPHSKKHALMTGCPGFGAARRNAAAGAEHTSARGSTPAKGGGAPASTGRGTKSLRDRGS